MATVKLKGNNIRLGGDFPATGSKAPDFKVIKEDLSEVGLGDFSGKIKVILAVPSLDTPVCAKEAREFNLKIGARDDVVLIVISGDLPFAMKRYCAAEGVTNVVTGSQYRNMGFSKSYGTHIEEGGLEGLSARAVFVIDRNDMIVYSELVPEITEEPDYEASLAALNKLSQ